MEAPTLVPAGLNLNLFETTGYIDGKLEEDVLDYMNTVRRTIVEVRLP